MTADKPTQAMSDEPCKHVWIANSGKGGLPVFKPTMGHNSAMHVLCSVCGARTWVTETDWDSINATAPTADARYVATVRVKHGGYAMELSTHAAYALPEGLHDLYAAPTEKVTAGADHDDAVIEQMARAMNKSTDGHDRYWSGYVKSATAAYEVARAALAEPSEAQTADVQPIYQIGAQADKIVWWDVDKATFDSEAAAGYMKTRVIHVLREEQCKS